MQKRIWLIKTRANFTDIVTRKTGKRTVVYENKKNLAHYSLREFKLWSYETENSTIIEGDCEVSLRSLSQQLTSDMA